MRVCQRAGEGDTLWSVRGPGSDCCPSTCDGRQEELKQAALAAADAEWNRAQAAQSEATEHAHDDLFHEAHHDAHADRDYRQDLVGGSAVRGAWVVGPRSPRVLTLDWFNEVLGTELVPDTFIRDIADGTLLCELAIAIDKAETKARLIEDDEDAPTPAVSPRGSPSVSRRATAASLASEGRRSSIPRFSSPRASTGAVGTTPRREGGSGIPVKGRRRTVAATSESKLGPRGKKVVDHHHGGYWSFLSDAVAVFLSFT